MRKTALVGFVLLPLLGVAALAGCAKGDPLSVPRIDTAARTWLDGGAKSYRLSLAITGDLVEEGEFSIEVRDGAINTVTRNGNVVSSRDPFYTVEGMFGFLREELEMAENPARYWQASQDARIYQRAHFDEELGFTRRYLRAVTGTKHNITVEISGLERL